MSVLRRKPERGKPRGMDFGYIVLVCTLYGALRRAGTKFTCGPVTLREQGYVEEEICQWIPINIKKEFQNIL